VRVLLVGEGVNDRGATGRRRSSKPGVLDALLDKLGSDFDVVDRLPWSRPPGDPVGGGRVRRRGSEAEQLLGVEAETLRRFVLHAEEHGCSALVALRDRDGDARREATLQRARDGEHQRTRSRRLRIVVGIPVERLEHWILACCGVPRAHTHPAPEEPLSQQHGVTTKLTSDYVDVIKRTDFARLPAGNDSLQGFMTELRQLFGV
jgi:hypothetical protein